MRLTGPDWSTGEIVGTALATPSLNLMQISFGARVADERIVAVGLLTQREVELLGHGFSRLWPVDESPCFTELLKAIDEADRELKDGTRRKDEAHLPSQSVPGGGRY